MVERTLFADPSNTDQIGEVALEPSRHDLGNATEWHEGEQPVEFLVIYTPRDPRRATARFIKWTPPAGYDIKAHYFSPEGRGFALVNADSPMVLVAGTAAFSDVMDFEITPVAPIEDVIPATLESLAWIDSVEAAD